MQSFCGITKKLKDTFKFDNSLHVFTLLRNLFQTFLLFSILFWTKWPILHRGAQCPYSATFPEEEHIVVIQHWQLHWTQTECLHENVLSALLALQYLRIHPYEGSRTYRFAVKISYERLHGLSNLWSHLECAWNCAQTDVRCVVFIVDRPWVPNHWLFLLGGLWQTAWMEDLWNKGWGKHKSVASVS